VVELSSYSDEEDPIPDTSCNFEFTQRLYDELNRALLGLPGDGKVIIISNSEEEVEAHEETTTEVEATPSAAAEKSSTPSASPADVDEDPGAMPNDSSDGLARVKTHARAALADTKSTHLRPSRQERLLWQACLKNSHVQRCYPSSSFVQSSWDGDVESLVSLMPFMPPQFSLFLLCS
jgi:hypothetical protein